ncbi:MAG: hypothetical protein K2P09_01980 [Erysipelotrichales bacterium]|nr:hypothetical protein [Erysipelotrichales bacterium]
MIDNNKIRVIKIGPEALFEFIYEKFIEEQECYLEVNPTSVTNIFDVDWENGQFIFCAYNSVDLQENIAQMPESVDLKKLMKIIPDTTKTMFHDKRYLEFSKKELIEICEEISPELGE